MATIAQNTLTGVRAPVALTSTTGTTSDTLVYASGTHQHLHIANPTAGILTTTLTGSTATTVSPAGMGGTVSVAAGKAIAVAANSATVVVLDDISAYLAGTITLTGGTGLLYTLYA